MSFLAPWALWAAGAVSAAVIALHILASKNPRVTALPTTKFIPDVPLRATARALRLSDVALMLLRVAVVMLVGVAFARPEVTRGKRLVGRVVMVDRSRAVNREEARDSAIAYYREGDALFIFDSATYDLRGSKFGALDVAGERILTANPRGSLSAGLARAMRMASSLRGEADSVEIVLISPFESEEIDAATFAIRAAWPGRIRVVRLGLATLNYREQVFHDIRGSGLEDPLRASLSFASGLDTGHIKTDSVRIDRGTIANVDTTWTEYGLTLVRWPAALDSSGYARREHLDSVGAVIAGDNATRIVVVSPFVRVVDPPSGRVVARWADGSPAATERKMMNGCVRDVAIPIAGTGDLALRESTKRLVAALSMPCDDDRQFAPGADSALAQLRGTGPLVATRALAARSAPTNHLTTWLLAVALVLLLLEPLLRRQRASA
ncbi:MAG TPA: BatA domain-containing protein [Gemmatimonadaceae bacterium]|nr:BatA domain-containing protein [Gemmatimonadaceae bacterium]